MIWPGILYYSFSSCFLWLYMKGTTSVVPKLFLHEEVKQRKQQQMRNIRTHYFLSLLSPLRIHKSPIVHKSTSYWEDYSNFLFMLWLFQYLYLLQTYIIFLPSKIFWHENMKINEVFCLCGVYTIKERINEITHSSTLFYPIWFNSQAIKYQLNKTVSYPSVS